MKITIQNLLPDEEEEIIIKCRRLDESLLNVLRQLGPDYSRLKCFRDNRIFLIEPSLIYYFESVDDRTYGYCEKDVFELKSKLYELEKMLPDKEFMRSAKSSIINLNKIKSVSPAFGGRYEALFTNGERVIISRQYVPVLKQKLGL